MLDQKKYKKSCVTCDVRFSNPLEYVNIKDGAKHSFKDSNLRSETERQQHHKEDDRPEWSTGKFNNGLSEYNKSQAGTFSSL